MKQFSCSCSKPSSLVDCDQVVPNKLVQEKFKFIRVSCLAENILQQSQLLKISILNNSIQKALMSSTENSFLQRGQCGHFIMQE